MTTITIPITSIGEDFVEELRSILKDELFTDIANLFAHYADSDVISREYKDIGEDEHDAWIECETRKQERELSGGW